jgi:hypothetical protein
MIPPLGDPNNHSTWGFYCETCSCFVHDIRDLRAELPSMGIVEMKHKKCDATVVYVGYRRD